MSEYDGSDKVGEGYPEESKKHITGLILVSTIASFHTHIILGLM